MTRRPAVFVGKTNAAILAGDEDITAWSEEELIRGQRKGKNGKWQGRKPKVVPRAVHDELVRRRLSKAGELLRDSLVDAVVLLRDVVTDDDAQYSDRIKAASIIIERVMGKTPERIQVEVEPPWHAALREALVGTSVAPFPVIDVDAVGDDD